MLMFLPHCVTKDIQYVANICDCVIPKCLRNVCVLQKDSTLKNKYYAKFL